MPHLIIDLAVQEKKPGKGYYSPEEKLDAAEADGWTLVTVDGGKAYLYQPPAAAKTRKK